MKTQSFGYYQEMAKFNQQLSVNSRLRKEIDHIRQDRLVFNGLFKKLSKELNDMKKSMNEIVTEASQAYEDRQDSQFFQSKSVRPSLDVKLFFNTLTQNMVIYRDEAQNKMLALKERSEKDIAQQEVEMKELYRIIDHDNRLKEFMMFKTCERTEFKEEEEAKKKKCKFITQKVLYIYIFGGMVLDSFNHSSAAMKQRRLFDLSIIFHYFVGQVLEGRKISTQRKYRSKLWRKPSIEFAR